MVAQGWQVTSTYTEEDCGQTFYAMARQSMMSWVILQACLNEFVQAYNEGRAANSIRYNDLLMMWTETIYKSRLQLDVQGDVSDGHLSLYITQFNTLVADIESEMDLAKAEMTTSGNAAAVQLAAYLVILNQLEPLYDTHETTAEEFLTNLGTTDLARINEQFDNSLSNLRQGMVNRGLYSSGLFAQTETRITRERNEAIAKLNDQLNREKLELENTLFGQEMSVKGAVLDGRAKLAVLQHQQSQFLLETRMKIATTIMQARLHRLQGRMDVRDKENALMAMQLDVRNNLVIGLMGQIERREDTYPSLEAMTKLITGLGDAGGGWVQP
jgi:hypothetical protein